MHIIFTSLRVVTWIVSPIFAAKVTVALMDNDFNGAMINLAIEFGIIAVKKEYQKLGVTGFIISKLLDRINAVPTVKYADTGVQLETNTGAITSLEMFERTLIRRKTCYIKKIVD